MFLREKLQNPLRSAIRQKLQSESFGEDRRRVRRLLFNDELLARLAAQTECLAAEKNASHVLAGYEVGGELSNGWRVFFDWIIAHWDDILRIILTIVPLLGDNEVEAEADPS